MATAFVDFSTVADNNTSVGSANVAENCPPSGINNAIRQEIAYEVDYFLNAGTIASASTTDLGTISQGYIEITGTTTITALGTPTNKVEYICKFAGALTLTHNATSLILPGGQSITTAAGDVARFRHEGSGNWRCTGAPPRWYNTAPADGSVTAQSLAVKGNFQPYAQSTPDMTIALAEGTLQLNTALVRIASQNTGTITAPSGNPRKDIVYIDALTGTIGVATGTEAASPADPAVPAGKIAIARITLATSTTAITNSLIADLRPLPTRLVKSSGQAISTSSVDTFAHGLGVIPEEFGAYLVADATPELGYTAGQRVDVSNFQGGATPFAISVFADATNVYIAWSSSLPFLLNVSTFAGNAQINAARWTVVLWARG